MFVQIWDAVSTKQTKVLRGHSDRVGTLAYRSSTVTNSGPDLVTGATDGTIHLWNTRSVDEDVDTSGEQ
jgi:WD40 repeat protein